MENVSSHYYSSGLQEVESATQLEIYLCLSQGTGVTHTLTEMWYSFTQYSYSRCANTLAKIKLTETKKKKKKYQKKKKKS